MPTPAARGLLVLIAAASACGGGDASNDPRCLARQALGDAVRAIGQADSAEVAGDEDTVRSRMDEVERLVARARRYVSASSASSIDRAMLEAAEYLDFTVGRYRSSGTVDGTLAQFASHELNRGPSPGEAPLNC